MTERVQLLLAQLADPHRQDHEDIVRELQALRPAEAVEALYRAAHDRHDYLEYDEFRGLARKCTWALADIGTPQARACLERLAAEPDPQVAEYAKKRLDHWEAESHRKANSSLSLESG